MGKRTRAGATAGALLAVAASLALAVPAAAEAPTRSAYVEKLEGICKPDVKATQRAMKGARKDVRKDRLQVAARKFAKGTRIFTGTVKGMAPVPRPPGDVARLKKWFKYLKRQESYLRRITAALRKEQAIKAQRLTARFIHNGNLANNAVLPLGFDYCRFKYSRFG